MDSMFMNPPPPQALDTIPNPKPSSPISNGNGESPKPSSTIATNGNDAQEQDLNEPIKLGAVQVTAKGYLYDVPDPNRIPSSVFDIQGNVVTSKEWSLASNESLFSLHAANSSCSPPPTSDDVSSTDEALIDDPYEITVVADNAHFANEAIETVETSNRSSCDDNVVNNIGGGTEASSPAINSPTISFHSESSVHSFAFPILTHGSGRMGGPAKEVEGKPLSEHLQQDKEFKNMQYEQLINAREKNHGSSLCAKLFPCLSCSCTFN